MSFPTSPTLNQLHTSPSSGVTFRWDGEKWTSYSGVNVITPVAGATGATGPGGVPGATGATGPLSTNPGPPGATGPAGAGGNIITPDAFGAVGNDTTDDTAAVQAAIDSLVGTGGTVIIPHDKKYRISTINVKRNIHIKGEHEMVGSNGNNTYTNYDALGSSLRVSGTINMFSGSSISGVYIKRYTATASELYTKLSTWAGTAITVSSANNAYQGTGETLYADDVTIRSCLIIGFNQAIYANYSQRIRITDVNIDCINGIYITNCLDVPYLTRVHCWGFGTQAYVARVNGSSSSGGWLFRNGTAFKLENTVDWAHITDCFAYGWFKGFHLINVNSSVLTNCGADNVVEAGSAYASSGNPQVVGAIGFSIEGACEESILTNCQSASQEKGYYIKTNSGTVTTLLNCQAWGIRDFGVFIEPITSPLGGDVKIIGGMYRDSEMAINCISTGSQLTVLGVSTRDISVTGPQSYVIKSTGRIYPDKLMFGNYSGSKAPVYMAGLPLYTISTANTLNLDPNAAGQEHSVIRIGSGGGAGIGNINRGYAGQKLTLIFTASKIIYNAGTTILAGDIVLAGSTNANMTNGSTITLVSNGVYWHEIGRSIR